MIAHHTPESSSTSRRALLTGAIGGLGALVASAIGRPESATAHDPDDVRLGANNNTTTTTQITNSTNSNSVFQANSSAGGVAIYGSTSGGAGAGVSGYSDADIGVEGTSNSFVGVQAISFANDRPASVGWSVGDNTGMQGYSGPASLPASRDNTGVYGYANQTTASRGVWGESPKGRAVQGSSTSGFAGYFAGKVYTSSFHEMPEISAPSAPAANKGRLFMRDNGSGKSQLCVRFNSGAVQVLATQP